MTVVILRDNPQNYDVKTLIENHLAFARSETPLCHVFALLAEEIIDDDILFYSCRDGDELLGIGALRKIGDGHFEIKSMHTALYARGNGVAQMMLDHLLEVASQSGGNRVSLETGTSRGFRPARSLYEKSGFKVCEPYGEYSASTDNVCMTLAL
ncbi:MAG TPA: GNAT family N-acetyltransferase [Acidimicrobiales bacterium]|nr:GNAT family N-acetyltransferase [Acidimicrobiales bacterium]